MTALLTKSGSTWAWRKLRLEVLARDGYLCLVPGPDGRPCRAPATHVDHIVPRVRGGSDDPANLRASCQRCNLTRGTGPRAATPSRDW